MSSRKLALALTAALPVTGANAAVFYTDYFDYIDEFDVVTTTTFSGPVAAPLSVSSPGGSVSGGRWSDVVDDVTGVTVWSFAEAITGFGGFFDLAGPGGPGSGLTITLGLLGGGSTVIGDIPNTLAGSFFGFINTIAFTSVTFSEDQACCRESYTLDNLTVGNNLTAVPLPASLGLLGLGVGGLVAFGRRRST